MQVSILPSVWKIYIENVGIWTLILVHKVIVVAGRSFKMRNNIESTGLCTSAEIIDWLTDWLIERERERERGGKGEYIFVWFVFVRKFYILANTNES